MIQFFSHTSLMQNLESSQWFYEFHLVETVYSTPDIWCIKRTYIQIYSKQKIYLVACESRVWNKGLASQIAVQIVLELEVQVKSTLEHFLYNRL